MLLKFKLVENINEEIDSLLEAKKKKSSKNKDNRKLTLNYTEFNTPEKLKKWVKKRQKGLSPFCYLNPNAGNVEYNNSMFNNMMGVTSDGASNIGVSNPGGISVGGGLSSTGAGAASNGGDGAVAGGAMGESFNLIGNKENHFELSTPLKNFIEKYIDLIDDEDWEQLFYQANQEVFKTDGDFSRYVPELRKVLEDINIDILKTLDYIPNDFYFNDSSITDLIIPDNIEMIGQNAFYDSDITSIKLPKNLLEIQEGAFQACDNLKYIELPNTLEFIHSNAFAFSDNLEKVHYLGTIDEFKDIEFGDSVFEDCPKLKHITCVKDNTIIELDEYGDPILTIKQ